MFKLFISQLYSIFKDLFMNNMLKLDWVHDIGTVRDLSMKKA